MPNTSFDVSRRGLLAESVKSERSNSANKKSFERATMTRGGGTGSRNRSKLTGFCDKRPRTTLITFRANGPAIERDPSRWSSASWLPRFAPRKFLRRAESYAERSRDAAPVRLPRRLLVPIPKAFQLLRRISAPLTVRMHLLATLISRCVAIVSLCQPFNYHRQIDRSTIQRSVPRPSIIPRRRLSYRLRAPTDVN